MGACSKKTVVRVVLCVAFLVSMILMLYGDGFPVMLRLKNTSSFEEKNDPVFAHSVSGTIKPINNKLQEQLQKLERVIKRANLHVRGTKTSSELRKAAKILNGIMEVFPKMDDQPWRQTVEPFSVCPEEYNKDTQNKVHPWFKVKNCTHAKSLKGLVTVIVHVNNTELAGERLNILLYSVHKDYKDVHVILVSDSKLVTRDEEMANIKPVTKSGASDGEVLNKLVEEVKTPYVLIARNVEVLTYDARLERLIREIETQQVPVAAGAVRDPQGHWDIGCYQTAMRNYSLKYFHGYDESFHECLFCDFAAGPFVTSVIFLKTFPFAALQARNGLFEDWFLRLTKENLETIVCPDSMFFTAYRKEASEWSDFMNKWNLREIHTSGGQTITSKCTDKLWKASATIALSPCKMRANAYGTNAMMELCEKHSIVCQLTAGTALGAVKFGHVLPWDIDADIDVLSKNFTSYRKLLSKLFKTYDYVKANYSRWYRAFPGHMNVDVCELYNLDSVELMLAGFNVTRVLFDGHWLPTPRNPGLFVRETYGREIYQHAMHYSHTQTSPQAAYKPNMLLPCELPGNHSCLDLYNGDGNIQFKYILP